MRLLLYTMLTKITWYVRVVESNRCVEIVSLKMIKLFFLTIVKFVYNMINSHLRLNIFIVKFINSN